MTPADPIEGGCLCGSVRYRIRSGTLRDLNDCHCIDCRRASGAPFVTWGTVDAADLEVRGPVREVAHAGRLRGFASCCGTPLFFRVHSAAETTDVAIATLDDPRPFAPRISIWTEDRLPWVMLDSNRPTFARGSTSG